MPPPETPKRRSGRTSARPADSALREAISPYLTIPRLRRLIAEQSDLYLALRCPDPPADVLALLDLLRALLYPAPRDQIKSPSDAAGLLLVDMIALDQEQLRTVLLDSKNRIQAIPTVYVGSLTTAMVRVGELFKDALSSL